MVLTAHLRALIAFTNSRCGALMQLPPGLATPPQAHQRQIPEDKRGWRHQWRCTRMRLCVTCSCCSRCISQDPWNSNTRDPACFQDRRTAKLGVMGLCQADMGVSWMQCGTMVKTAVKPPLQTTSADHNPEYPRAPVRSVIVWFK